MGALFYANPKRRFSMIRSIPRASTLFLAALAVCGFASFANADKRQSHDAKTRCEDHLRRQLKQTYSHATIEFTQSKEWQPSATQTGLSGEGALTRANDRKLNFEWNCVYDTKTNKVVKASHTKLKFAEPKTPAKKK
jgi:hypothetical protein